jgi:hypothetical protein
LDTVTGPPDRRKLARKVGEAANWQQLEAASDAMLGPSGFSEFARFHRGQLLTKAPGAATADIVRIALADPPGMKQRVELAPDAASYAGGPAVIGEGADVAHLSCSRMASSLASCVNLAALEVARSLDYEG